jgi:hypothetical protein
MENTTIEIGYRRKQAVVMALLMILFALPCLYASVFVPRLGLIERSVCIFGVLLCGSLGFMCIKRALGSKIGLTIDDQGIINASAALRPKRILWQNIADMRDFDIAFRGVALRRILLVINDPISGKSKKVAIVASNLIYDRDELFKLLQERLDRYRNRA